MLNSLVEKVGPEKIKHLVQLSLPGFERDYAELLEQLDNPDSDYEQVIKAAHALKSTASLFVCEQLFNLLEKIEAVDQFIIKQASFKQQLEEAFQCCLTKVQHLLD